MKEFMMIFIGGDYETGGMSPDEFERRMQRWNQWVEELQKEELYLGGRALKNTKKQVVEEKGVAVDGAYVEIKELVTGYFLIKARDFDHAASLTKSYPDYDLGGRVELREIQSFE